MSCHKDTQQRQMTSGPGSGVMQQLTKIGPEDVDVIELSPSFPPAAASFKELSDNLQLKCRETFPHVSVIDSDCRVVSVP
jgi:hypothetical protein